MHSIDVIVKTCPCKKKKTYLFSAEKLNISPEKNDIFNIFAQKLDRECTLEPPHCGDYHTYPQSIFLSKNKNIYPYIPQFCYTKVGFKGLYITRTCFPDV